jgi:probable rRNA maturation factor
MRHTPRKISRGNSHFSLDKQAKARVDLSGADARRLTLGGERILLNKQRNYTIDRRRVRRFLSALASELDAVDRAFSVVFITDQVMRRYNREYRGYDKPTDVLSFTGEQRYLGDILISADTAYNQARKSKTLTFEKNIRRLILHGFLHLLGYDHETDEGQMRSIERRLRRRFQC